MNYGAVISICTRYLMLLQVYFPSVTVIKQLSQNSQGNFSATDGQMLEKGQLHDLSVAIIKNNSILLLIAAWGHYKCYKKQISKVK